jgi:hypothetical protein
MNQSTTHQSSSSIAVIEQFPATSPHSSNLTKANIIYPNYMPFLGKPFKNKQNPCLSFIKISK